MTAAHHIERLKYLRITACFTISCIGGTDMGEALVAAAEVEEMMDTFFADYGPLFSSGDHEAAKANPELFISLIDRAIRHFTQEAEEESSI